MTRSWWENEDIIRRFRDWLVQTEEEIAALEESSDRGAPARRDGAAGASAHDAAREGDHFPDGRDLPDGLAAGASELPAVGLLQLAEAFTALRHELKLQTKGARSLEASVEQSLAGLDSASRVFQAIQADERQAAERAARPMIEALIGLDEGLLRAARAFQTTHRQLTESAPARLRESLDKQFAEQSWWRRRLAAGWHAQVRKATCEALARSIAEEFAALMEGFQLIQSRLARTLRELDVCRLDASGGLVDPNRMNVVELVTDAAAPPETVVEVVRPGYTWGSRVIRFAEVRAVARRVARFRDDPAPPDRDVARQDSEEAMQSGFDPFTQIDKT